VTVKEYSAKGRKLWAIDVDVVTPDGKRLRHRQRKIPTKAAAEALERKVAAEAFEGRYFDKRKTIAHTVRDLWPAWEAVIRQENDSWKSDVGRAAHLLRHLGDRVASQLTPDDVVLYRAKRMKEVTCRGGPPLPATLNREQALLRAMLNHAERCGKLGRNPIAGASMLKEENIRTVVFDEEGFSALLEAADPHFRAILLTDFDTGMRRNEVLKLQRPWLDLGLRRLAIPAEYTKGGKARTIYLTSRTVAAIQALPVVEGTPYIFVNPKTRTRWKNTSRMWKRAKERVGRTDAWFHDLRRSFITNARRRGISEKVAMEISGHLTRSPFERYNIVEERDVKEAAKLYEQGAERELAAGSKEPDESSGSDRAEPGPEHASGVDNRRRDGVDK
jgi:integrase